MNGLGKMFILIFLLYQVQQGEQASLLNMGLIIVLSNSSWDAGRMVSKHHIPFNQHERYRWRHEGGQRT